MTTVGEHSLHSPSATTAAGVPKPSRAVWWTIVGVNWTSLAALSISQSAISRAYRGEPMRWGPLVAVRLADWYTCALFIPAFFWLARRYPIERGTWRPNAAIHLVASVVFVVA